MGACAAEEVTGWVTGLVRRHTGALAAVAQSEGLTRFDALDAVQEGFDRFLRRPDARALVADEGASRAMLITLVRNTARNMRRRHYRARPHDALDETQLAASDKPIDQLLAEAETEVRVRACMKLLKDVQQRVVTLRMLEELSGQEVAERLGLSPGNVAVLLHRAHKQLAECIGS